MAATATTSCSAAPATTRVIGGQGDDVLHGDEGNDTIFGGDGIDTIFGGDGNDYIEGGRGDDVITGGLGNDIIITNEGFDAPQGNEGDDWIESRGGQGEVMFGDSGAPTGQVPLYSGNDVMVGGVAGGDIMKGFSGDDIMEGHGSFTKFIGGLGYDWGSYELATQGVQEDMNRKEFVAANGAVDNVRDVWQETEGASGSAFDDIMLGTNDTRLVLSRNELDNVNLITGLQGFFDPGVVSFDAGNIMLGGGGSDRITGGGGNDIIDGDAYLHVGLTSYTAGAQIIRQINYDPNGNTYDPATAYGDWRPGPATSMPPMSTLRSTTTSWPTTTLPCSARMLKASSRLTTPGLARRSWAAIRKACSAATMASTGSGTSNGSSSPMGRLPSTRMAT